MNAEEFRLHIQGQLKSSGDRILLRVLVSRGGPQLVELTGPELLSRCLQMAKEHCQAPLGTVVLLLLPHSVELFLLHLGLVLSGRLPAILAWPTDRVDAEKYQNNLLHQLRNLPANQLITLPLLAKSLTSGLPYTTVGFSIFQCEKFEKAFAEKLSTPSVLEEQRTESALSSNPGEALFLQFTGGTTGAQKCVVVDAPMLVNQLTRLTHALEYTDNDGVASWLPMYHDMGLIACLWVPLWNRTPSTQFAASDWLMEPDLLFRFIHTYKATFSWLPNFAFAYLAQQRHRISNNSDLSHVRAWINCSEPVRQKSFDAFVEAFSSLGVRPERCQASYAMAENVFGVTQTKLGVRPTCIPRTILRSSPSDKSELRYETGDETFVASGEVIPGMKVRVRSLDGKLCADDTAGGIEISGESLFRGYWGAQGYQTQTMTDDGWYATGDYGFLHDSKLYVIGRIKDIIIVAGQNVFPEDVEYLAGGVSGVYPGRVVAFGVEDALQGTQSLSVVAEMRGDFEQSYANAIEREIHRQITAGLGIAPRHVRVVPERWIVKSTAGKISRRESRRRFLQEFSGQAK